MVTEPGARRPLTMTDAARAKVQEILDSEPDADSLALCVAVSGFRDGGYAYDMYFQPVGEIGPDDWIGVEGNLRTVVPASSVEKLVGSVLDVDGSDPDGGMTIRNPNRPEGRSSPPMSGPLEGMSGDVSERVTQVLERQVNPSIAAHGGRADLVAVEEGTAYLRLSGGCAGCGMVTVTLNQGIEVAIKQSVPEIVRVVDVTDHASGSNPYYEPAKK